MNNIDKLIYDVNILIQILEYKIKRVVRNNKIVKKKTCGEGYKFNSNTNKCEKMSPLEIINRRRSQKRASFKRKSKSSQINRKRNKSNQKRKSF